jgi:hypothetical protein
MWPPADFYLEVRAGRWTDGGLREEKSFHVFADGLAVYREVPADAEDWPPLFAGLCAYRMAAPSLRSLGRSLAQAGLFDLDAPGGADPDATEVVAVIWRGFGREGEAIGRGRVYGPMVQVLHIINAYLPQGRSFELPDMTGEPERPRLGGVPQPAFSAEESYAQHLAWEGRFAGDVRWQVELLALAHHTGHGDKARELLAQIEAAQSPFADATAAGERRVLLERLRRLIDG